MRKAVTLITVIAVAVLVVGLVAVDEPEAKDPGGKDPKKLSGKELYKGNCKPCHGPNSPNGEISPLTLIQDQWTRFFDKEYESSHKEFELPDRPGTKLFDALDEDMLKKVRKFAIDHAADSENPMTCG